jgi:hypothetical protein
MRPKVGWIAQTCLCSEAKLPAGRGGVKHRKLRLRPEASFRTPESGLKLPASRGWVRHLQEGVWSAQAGLCSEAKLPVDLGGIKHRKLRLRPEASSRTPEAASCDRGATARPSLRPAQVAVGIVQGRFLQVQIRRRWDKSTAGMECRNRGLEGYPPIGITYRPKG